MNLRKLTAGLLAILMSVMIVGTAKADSESASGNIILSNNQKNSTTPATGNNVTYTVMAWFTTNATNLTNSGQLWIDFTNAGISAMNTNNVTADWSNGVASGTTAFQTNAGNNSILANRINFASNILKVPFSVDGQGGGTGTYGTNRVATIQITGLTNATTTGTKSVTTQWYHGDGATSYSVVSGALNFTIAETDTTSTLDVVPDLSYVFTGNTALTYKLDPSWTGNPTGAGAGVDISSQQLTVQTNASSYTVRLYRDASWDRSDTGFTNPNNAYDTGSFRLALAGGQGTSAVGAADGPANNTGSTAAFGPNDQGFGVRIYSTNGQNADNSQKLYPSVANGPLNGSGGTLGMNNGQFVFLTNNNTDASSKIMSRSTAEAGNRNSVDTVTIDFGAKANWNVIAGRYKIKTYYVVTPTY